MIVARYWDWDLKSVIKAPGRYARLLTGWVRTDGERPRRVMVTLHDPGGVRVTMSLSCVMASKLAERLLELRRLA